MAPYVLKTFDANGRLRGRAGFRAGRDAEAAAAMRYLHRDRQCELWCGKRKVAAWDGVLADRLKGKGLRRRPSRSDGVEVG